MAVEADNSGRSVSNETDAPFSPADDAAEMFVIPESWAEHGSHPQIHNELGESWYFATRVASHPDHDEILVRYYSPAKQSTVTRGYEAVEVDGSVVPKVVVEKGPEWFRASISHSHRRANDLDSRVDTDIVADRYGDAAVHGVFRPEDVL
jgi:hypothetical protein